MRILIDFKNLSDSCSAAPPLHSKRDRKSDEIDQEIGPPQKKSKLSGSPVADIHQSPTSMSAEASSVCCLIPLKNSRRTEQNIRIADDISNVPSSDITEKVNAVQPGNILELI